jgi:hypothetical protein
MPADQPLLNENEISSNHHNSSDAEAYLPWERFEGFLWGLPATWWLIITRPFQAFAAPAKAGWPRALGFVLVVYLITYLSFFAILLYFDDWYANPKWDGYTQRQLYQIVLGWPLRELIAVLLFSAMPVWFLQRAFCDKPHRAVRILRYCLYMESLNIFILVIGLGSVSWVIASVPIDHMIGLVKALWLAIAMSANKGMGQGKALVIAFMVIFIRAVFTWFMYKI